MPSVYDELGGAPAILRLAVAWHARCLEDPVVSHAFSHPDLHPQHTERLAAYWTEALGGPAGYSGGLGDHSHVLRLHSGHGSHEDMDRRGERCFAQAIDDTGIAGDPDVRGRLVDWFHEMTVAMAAHPNSAEEVPAGLSIPVLGSEGLGEA